MTDQMCLQRFFTMSNRKLLVMNCETDVRISATPTFFVFHYAAIKLICSLKICTTYEKALVSLKNQASPPSMDQEVTFRAKIEHRDSLQSRCKKIQ